MKERNKTNKQTERTNKKNGRATVFKNRKRRKKEGNFLENFVLSIFLLFSHKSICHQSLKPVQSNFQFTEIKQANFNSANLNFSLFVLSSLFVFSLLKKVEFFFQVLIYGFGFNMTSSNITIFSFYLFQCFFEDVTQNQIQNLINIF